MYYVALFIGYLKSILIFLIIVRIILSWLRTPQTDPFHRFIVESTEPIMKIARKITPRTGMLDFSPIIAVIGIDLLASALLYLINYI